MDINNYKNWLKINTDSENTVSNYLYQIDCFFNKFTEFNQSNVDQYLSDKVNSISKNTFNVLLYALKNYSKFSKINIEFPKQKKTDTKLHEYLTEEEFKNDILKYRTEIFGYKDIYNIILNLFFYTGLRSEELIKLKVENINFKDRIILVKDTKGKKDREIFSINDELFTQLELYCKDHKDPYGRVFNITYEKVYNIFRKINTELNYKIKLHPHLMRVSFAKHCLTIGLDVSIIQKLLGHNDIETTMLYAEPDRKMIKEACERVKNRKEIKNGK